MSLRVRELTFLDPNVSDQCLISLLAFFAFYLRIRRRHQHVTRSSVLELSGSSTQPTDIYSLVANQHFSSPFPFLPLSWSSLATTH